MKLKEDLVIRTFGKNRPTVKQVCELFQYPMKKEEAKKIIRSVYDVPVPQDLYNCGTMCEIVTD
jgi:hypothetical protein